MSAIHFHSSDSRFCGSTEHGRQFSCDDGEVTCPHCAPARALLSEQGTVCEETILLADEFTLTNRARIERQFCDPRVHSDPPVPGTWVILSSADSFVAA